MTDYFKVGDTVKAGEVILLTDGSYSQYGVSGVFRAREEFTIKAMQTKGFEGKPDCEDVEAHCEEIKTRELWGGCN